MEHTNVHQRRVGPGPVFVMLFLAFACGCNINPLGMSGPYTESEIIRRLDNNNNILPVYGSKFGANSDILLSFYFYSEGFDSRLMTFFFRKRGGQQGNRIAKMIISLRPPAMDDALSNSRRVMVSWANGSSASTCVFTPGTISRDSLPGDPYQTCVVWRSGEYSFLFYSVMPLEETLNLINSLERIR